MPLLHIASESNVAFCQWGLGVLFRRYVRWNDSSWLTGFPVPVCPSCAWFCWWRVRLLPQASNCCRHSPRPKSPRSF